MPTRADVVAAARSYLGVRWHHQGRNRAGLDCVGLVVVVAQELGLSTYDPQDYGRTPDAVQMRAQLAAHLDPRRTPAPGDVILLRYDRFPLHMGIASELNGELAIVHAFATMRRVVEHRLDATWLARVVSAHAFRGIA